MDFRTVMEGLLTEMPDLKGPRKELAALNAQLKELQAKIAAKEKEIKSGKADNSKAARVAKGESAIKFPANGYLLYNCTSRGDNKLMELPSGKRYRLFNGAEVFTAPAGDALTFTPNSTTQAAGVVDDVSVGKGTRIKELGDVRGTSDLYKELVKAKMV
jgi:hypothetical protein